MKHIKRTSSDISERDTPKEREAKQVGDDRWNVRHEREKANNAETEIIAIGSVYYRKKHMTANIWIPHFFNMLAFSLTEQ